MQHTVHKRHDHIGHDRDENGSDDKGERQMRRGGEEHLHHPCQQADDRPDAAP